jgi:outer membrane protein OmpA-like peptidoglycan-associated protein
MMKNLSISKMLISALILTLVGFGLEGNMARAQSSSGNKGTAPTTGRQNTNQETQRDSTPDMNQDTTNQDRMNQGTQRDSTPDMNQDTTNQNTRSETGQLTRVAEGQKTKIQGVIVGRQDNMFTVRDQNGAETMVTVTNDTKVREKKSNPFRGAKKYTTDQLLRGLNVEVEGRGDRSGNLVADNVKFTQDELGVARSIQSQVVPVESRLGQAETRLGQTEQNAQRLSGQVEELSEIANVARGGAKAAQETADQAMTGVTRTNERISDLDNYEERATLMVNFKVGSANLSPEAKAKLDDMAARAQNQKGYLIEVAGFASADGSEPLNRRLSEKRADAVVRYLVEQHMVPLRRIITPFGYGEAQPVADNSTRDGRRQNRRVEVRLLVNRGVTETPTVSQTSSIPR